MGNKYTEIQSAVILAAGYGKRLRPLTDVLPKPLFPIGNKTALSHILDKLDQLGVSRFYLNTHHFADRIERFIAGYKLMNCTLKYEPVIRDTGGGVQNFREHLCHQTFLLHNCDVYSEEDLQGLIEMHLQSDHIATLMVINYPEINSLKIDAGLVKDFHSTSGSATYSGIAVFSPKIWQFFSRDTVFSLITVLENAIHSGASIGVYHSERYWTDFGTPQKFFNLHKKLAEDGDTKPVNSECVKDSKLDGFNFIPDSAIVQDCDLKNCIVFPDMNVRGETHENTIICEDFRIKIDD